MVKNIFGDSHEGKIKVKGEINMNTWIKFEEIANLKAVSFTAVCEGPEAAAWYALRDWAIKNISDYESRRFIGFAPAGHHPNGQDSDFHAYTAQMLLYGCEGDGQTYMGAKVTDAPAGLYLVGDVTLDKFCEDGTADIGACMQKSSQIIYAHMQSMGSYDLDFSGRTFIEEHLFPKEWFTANDPSGIFADFKFWLPIKKKLK